MELYNLLRLNKRLREFTNTCNDYMKNKHLRIMTTKQIGKILREEGYQVGARTFNDISAVVILNLTLKTIKTIKTIDKPNHFPYEKMNWQLNSYNSYNSSEQDSNEEKFITTAKELMAVSK